MTIEGCKDATRWLRWAASLIVAMALIVAATAQAAPDRIVLADDKDYPPFVFLDASGMPKGILVDIWKLWSAKTGIPVTFQLMEWDAALTAVQEGRADALCGMFRTPEREAAFDLTRAFTEVSTSLFFHQQLGGIKNASDLAGFKIGVVKGDIAENLVSSLHPGLTFAHYPGARDLVAAAVAGEIKVFASDTPVALFYLAQHPGGGDFRHSSEPIAVNSLHSAVRKGNHELLAVLDGGFERISDSEIKAILDDWSGVPLFMTVQWGYLAAGFAALSGALFAVFFWNLLLRRMVRAKTEVLQIQKDRYGSILEATNVGTWEWNVQTGETVFNERWAEIIGYTLQEISPVSIETWMKFAHPDDLQISGEQLEKHFKGQLGYYDCELRMRHKNGPWIWVHDRGKVISRTIDGKPLWVYGAHQDITERKRTEQTLGESEKRFRTLIEFSPVPIILALRGHILFVNDAFRKLALIDSDESLEGKSILDFVAPEERERISDFMAKRAANGSAPELYESTGIRADGSRFPYEINITSVALAEGVATLAFVRDLSESKREIQRLHDTRERIERQRAALAALSNDPALYSGDTVESLKKITEAAASAIRTDRVSIWLFSEDLDGLNCVDLFEMPSTRHSAGAVLKAVDYPRYFEAIIKFNRVNAPDARSNPHTEEFRETYLAPLGIVSMLDAGITTEGKLKGVVCFEHSGEKREWHTDDESFSSTIASIVSQILINDRRRQAEDALRASEERLREIGDNLPGGMIYQIIIPKDGPRYFTYLSTGVEPLHGYTVEEARADAMLLYRQVHPDDVERMMREEKKALDTLTIFDVEARFILRSGEVVWRRLISRPRLLDNGGVIADGIEIDITERKTAEDRIVQLNQELEQKVEERTEELRAAVSDLKNTNITLENTIQNLNYAQHQLVQSEKLAALGQLVAGIAHELNTPVGNAVLAASTLADRERGFTAQIPAGLTRSALQQFVATVRDGSEILQRNLRRAAELISSFKQVAVDQASYQRRAFALEEVVHEIALALSPMLHRSPATLEVAIAPDLRLDSFPGPLGQVLMNLITNALVHAFAGRERGVIRIESIPAAPGRVGLRVSDDGNGIAPAHLSRLFDPFFTTRLGQGGSGLGLHIVYNLVTGLLGGTITVHSTPGQGAMFELDLPLIAPSAETRAEADFPGASTPNG